MTHALIRELITGEQFKKDQEKKKAAAYKAEKERWDKMTKQDVDPEEVKTVSLRF